MYRDRIIERENIEAYFYCPLAYRYRYELEFPYHERDKEILFTEGAKYAVASWFDSIASGTSRKHARNKMGLRLDLIWRNLGFNAEDYPMAHATIIQILLELENKFRESRDLVIGGEFTGSLPLNGWAITDMISGLYIEQGKRSNLSRAKRPLVAVQVAHDSTMGKLPSMARLRQAITKYSLNTGSKEVFGSGHPPKLMVVHVPSIQVRTYDLQYEDYRETIWLASSILDALDKQVYIPTDTLNRCRSCWYRSNCSNYYTIQEPSKKRLDQTLRQVSSRLP